MTPNNDPLSVLSEEQKKLVSLLEPDPYLTVGGSLSYAPIEPGRNPALLSLIRELCGRLIDKETSSELARQLLNQRKDQLAERDARIADAELIAKFIREQTSMHPTSAGIAFLRTTLLDWADRLENKP